MDTLPELRQIFGLLAIFVVTLVIANGAARVRGHRD